MHSIHLMNIEWYLIIFEPIVRADTKRGSIILNSYPPEYDIMEYYRKNDIVLSDTLKCYRNIDIDYGKE